MELADWLLQIEKLALLIHSQAYELATSKSINTPYTMLKQIGNNTNWQDIKGKLEEVYSLIAMEVHAASVLHRKQRPGETLQKYMHNFTGLTE